MARREVLTVKREPSKALDAAAGGWVPANDFRGPTAGVTHPAATRLRPLHDVCRLLASRCAETFAAPAVPRLRCSPNLAASFPQLQ
jgi:hypothetical protein